MKVNIYILINEIRSEYLLLIGENKIIYNIKWSRCGNYLVTSEYGGICKIFETKNFSEVAAFGKYHEDERVIRLIFSTINKLFIWFFNNKAWCCDVDFRETSKNKFKIFVGYEVNLFK